MEPDTRTKPLRPLQFGLAALAQGSLAKRFVSVAGWYHDPVSVSPFYGGSDGMAARFQAAAQAVDRFLSIGSVDTVPAYRAGDPAAAMFIEMDYYGNGRRGAVPSWTNEMATMSWYYWLLFDGISAADHVQVPTLLVHSDGSAFRIMLAVPFAACAARRSCYGQTATRPTSTISRPRWDWPLRLPTRFSRTARRVATAHVNALRGASE